MSTPRATALLSSTILGIALLLVASPALRAGEFTAPEGLEAWLPDDLVGYVKLSRLGDRLDGYLSSDARKDLESMDIVKVGMSQEPWQKMLQALADFRSVTSKEPLPVFKDLLGREVVIGFRKGPEGQSVVILTRAAGVKELEGALATVRQFLASKIGYSPEGYKTPQGDAVIETIGEGSFASLGPVWVIGNRLPLIQSVVDLARGTSKASLKASPAFQKAAALASGDPIAFVAARKSMLPELQLPEKMDNPLASLLLGGILGSLQSGELVTAALRSGEGSLELELSSVLGQDGLGKRFEPFFPAAAEDPAAVRLEKRGILTLARLHRDLKDWWAQREDLMIPKAANVLLKVDQVLSAIFAGKSFQDDLLPAMGPRITVVAMNQGYKGFVEAPKPAIPAIALVLEMQNSKELQGSLASAFQALVGILNLGMVQQNQGSKPFILKTEKVGTVEMQLAEREVPKDGRPDLASNFSPSLAVAGSRVILSSSAELTRILAEEMGGAAATTPVGAAQDSVLIDSEAVGTILGQNLELIITDNMRKKGVQKEEASREMDIFLQGLKRLQDLRIESQRQDGVVQMRMRLRHKLGKVQTVQGGSRAGAPAGDDNVDL